MQKWPEHVKAERTYFQLFVQGLLLAVAVCISSVIVVIVFVILVAVFVDLFDLMHLLLVELHHFLDLGVI